MLLTTKTRSKLKRLLQVLLSTVAVLSAVFFLINRSPIRIGEAQTNNDSLLLIQPNTSITRQLTKETKDEFGVAVDQGKLLSFNVNKGDLLLSVAVYGPSGTKLLQRVSHESEEIIISVTTEVTGIYRIEIESQEHTGISKQYSLAVQSLRPPTPKDQRQSEAERLFETAESLRAGWTERSFRDAISLYDKAAETWHAASDSAKALQSSLKAADICFSLGQYRDAQKRYEIIVALSTKANNWLLRATALSHLGRLNSYLGNNELAQKQATQAENLFKDSERNLTLNSFYGETLSNLAEINYAKGDLLKSFSQFESAGQQFQNDRKGQAKVHLFKGYIAGSLGEPEKAFDELSLALNLSQAMNDKTGEAFALTALGLSHSLKRSENDALELHRKAFEIFRTIGDRHGEAVTLNALGQSYENLNEFSIALSNYEQALRLFENDGVLDGAAVSAFKIARLHQKSAHLDQAFVYYQQCLRLSRAAGLVRTEVNALTEIAKVYATKGERQQALQQYQKIQSFYQKLDDYRGQATALNARGDYLVQLGEKQQALQAFSQALPLSDRSGNKGTQISTRYNIAKLNLELGHPETALSLIKKSLEIIEALRASVESPDQRVFYFAGFRKNYELCIRVLMQLEQTRPGNGFATEALLISEQSRARTLLDLVGKSGSGVSQGAPKELLEREMEIRGLLRAHAQYQLDRSLNKKSQTESSEVLDQLAQLRSEYQEIQAKLRKVNPHNSALEEFRSINLQQIQDQLRGSDTMLLEYSLGNDQSYLWAVTANSLHSFELPPGKTIEAAALEVYNLMTAREKQDQESDGDYQTKIEISEKLYFDKATTLSQMLLGPVAGELGNKKILLVTEGTLQYLPFDALPLPLSTRDQKNTALRPPLIETNEISELPSISTLLAIRATRTQRGSPDRIAAVIADPIFGRDDPRVHIATQSNNLTTGSGNQAENSKRSPTTKGLRSGLTRLIHSADEAEAIVESAPRGTTFVAQGFDATSETVTARVGPYQIIHFATHGFLDAEHPELSGIVLTRVDQNGGEKNGLMSIPDIYNLNLSAELTVLSACQTGLGKDVNGEGLLSLTHSFMSAGSKSVVASLWKVDDRATAVLMESFYDELLVNGEPTATALRSAKLKMLKDKRWNAPYYWAGFVLHGEHTNRIAVERSSKFAFVSVFALAVILASSALIVFQRRSRRVKPA